MHDENLVWTTEGLKPPEVLERRNGVDEDERATITWKECWFEGRLVRRDVHIDLKTSVFGAAEVGG